MGASGRSYSRAVGHTPSDPTSGANGRKPNLPVRKDRHGHRSPSKRRDPPDARRGRPVRRGAHSDRSRKRNRPTVRDEGAVVMEQRARPSTPPPRARSLDDLFGDRYRRRPRRPARCDRPVRREAARAGGGAGSRARTDRSRSAARRDPAAATSGRQAAPDRGRGQRHSDCRSDSAPCRRPRRRWRDRGERGARRQAVPVACRPGGLAGARPGSGHQREIWLRHHRHEVYGPTCRGPRRGQSGSDPIPLLGWSRRWIL